MQIIPVIDILNGIAVHAVAGQRQFYRPVQSVLCDGSDPGRMLMSMKRRLRVTSCYVADIDGIQQRNCNQCSLAEMNRAGVSLLVDSGVRRQADIEPLVEMNVDRVVLGSETIEDRSVVRELADQYGPSRLVFSVDIRNGQLQTANSEWKDLSPLSLALEAASLGITQFILLDLAAIGTGRGVPTLALCRELRNQIPSASIIAGGGVRTVADLNQLEAAGADGALVATAVHNGLLNADDIHRFAHTAAA
jgi:phosphoribosylformimino-5-aminoimidazole carboxamide ribotide isomerase